MGSENFIMTLRAAQGSAQRVCESVENVLVCRVYFSWFYFFGSLFVYIAVNCMSENPILQTGFVVGGCDL